MERTYPNRYALGITNKVLDNTLDVFKYFNLRPVYIYKYTKIQMKRCGEKGKEKQATETKMT